MENGFFQMKVTPRFCDCDYKKQARMAVVVGYMADIAGIAYAEKGYTHQWLWDNGLVFLVSKGSVHINRMPRVDEEINVITWEHSIKGVVFNRMFEMQDSGGEKLLSACTGWVLINPQSRTLLRPTAFTDIGRVDLNPQREAAALPFGRIKINNDCEPSMTVERRLVYSDIDSNGHVYNAVYVAIATDMLSSGEHQKTIRDYRINFIHEAVLGEVMLVKKYNLSDSCIVVKGYVGEKESFECEFIFE